MSGVRQAGLGCYHSKQPMAEHAAKIRGAVESSFDVRGKIKAVNKEPAGVTCVTLPRAPITSASWPYQGSFIYVTVEQPNLFFLHTLQEKKRRFACYLLTSLTIFTFHPGLLHLKDCQPSCWCSYSWKHS